jgi:excisionase family DNA binding protein
VCDPAPVPPLLTLAEAHAYLGGNFGRDRLRQLARSGELPVVRLGRKTLVHRELLDEWLRQQVRGGGDE